MEKYTRPCSLKVRHHGNGKFCKLTELRFEISGGRQLLVIPIRINANFRGHTHSKKRRHQVQQERGNTRIFLQAKTTRPLLPCTVKLVRIAPRLLDEEDNLRTAFKSVKDGICDWLGITDAKGCPVSWQYDQERGAPHTYGCRIEIWNPC